MNPAEYERMHALEDWYWWFVARRAAAAQFVRDYAPVAAQLERPLRVLDAGCGTGGMLDLYATWSDVEAVGLDFSPDALRFSGERGHRSLVGGDLTNHPFRSNSFEVVSALDVVEHVRDDAGAVREISRVLAPGGILVASVPAYQFLWGPHDVALHHHRRYAAAQFSRLLKDAGLLVEKQTYLLCSLFPLAAAVRLATRGKEVENAAAALPKVPPLANRALIGFQAAELAIARKVSLPFGLTVLTVARKPLPIHVRSRLPAVEERLAVPATAVAAASRSSCESG